MTARLALIRRHPIKAHGREALETVHLTAGETMPWDRTWAVSHEASKLDGTAWVRCANFSRGAKAPALMAIESTLDETAGRVTLTHPDLPELTFAPDAEADAFLAWVAPIMPPGRARSTGILRVSGQGMTDSAFPSISLHSLDTLTELSEKIGRRLSPERFRGNLWLEGAKPWEEFDWIGRTLRIGTAELTIRERITRCMATATNPDTGARDADTLGTLEAEYGHRQFGIYAEVSVSGDISVGDKIELL